MGIFNNNAELEKKVESLKLTKRLEKGKHDKEIANKDREIDKLNSKIELLLSQKTDIKESLDYYKGLEIDREQIELGKKKLEMDKQDLAYEKEEIERKEVRINKRLTRLEAEENDEYKKGYSDGLADGLRKAHDITREDRKYMTMIAMSTNQSQAIETSVKALEGGFKDESTNGKSS